MVSDSLAESAVTGFTPAGLSVLTQTDLSSKTTATGFCLLRTTGTAHVFTSSLVTSNLTLSGVIGESSCATYAADSVRDVNFCNLARSSFSTRIRSCRSSDDIFVKSSGMVVGSGAGSGATGASAGAGLGAESGR